MFLISEMSHTFSKNINYEIILFQYETEFHIMIHLLMTVVGIP